MVVPSLQINLISLDSLDNFDWTYFGGDGQICVVKGALIVIKGKLTNGIYSKFSDRNCCSFDTFQKDNGNTKVWHQGLCHMSEKGLFVLSMQ